MAGLVLDPPSASGTLGGLVPRLKGTETVLLAASMLGATVMPHAIYLHSSLVNHRFADRSHSLKRLLRASKFDVTWALILAGLVNIGLLLLAASSLFGVKGTDTIEGAHGAIVSHLGSGMGIIFGIGLLASGLASTSVGAYAGSEIMLGLLHVKVPLVVRRLVTLIPALIIVGAGMDPTLALVWSQALLSVGIPFAIIPLMRYTAKKEIMGEYVDSTAIKVIGFIITALIVCLNLALLYLTAAGIE